MIRKPCKTFHGNPCKRGHSGLRYTSSRNCIECTSANNAARRAANPEREAANSAAWAKANPEKVKASAAAWAKSNPEKANAWRLANPEKAKAAYAAWKKENPEKLKAYCGAWRAANPKKINAYSAKRRALKREQLCSCCTSKQIESLYLQCGPGAEVDHIMPLEAAAVLGLKGFHCISNLQILPAEVHKEKTHTWDRQLIARLKRDRHHSAEAEPMRLAA